MANVTISNQAGLMYVIPGQNGSLNRSTESQPTSWMLKIVALRTPAFFIDSRSRVIPYFVTLAPCQCHHTLIPLSAGGAAKMSDNEAGETTSAA